MTAIRALFFLGAASAGLVAGCTAISVVPAPAPMTIATEVPGSICHPVGNAICRLFNLAEAARAGSCIAVSSEGSLASLQRVRRGVSTLGLAQSDVAYAAFRGEGPFASTGPDKALRSSISVATSPALPCPAATSIGRLPDREGWDCKSRIGIRCAAHRT
jgi:TRAP-type uncharacterized transport system substrate-binding protein